MENNAASPPDASALLRSLAGLYSSGATQDQRHDYYVGNQQYENYYQYQSSAPTPTQYYHSAQYPQYAQPHQTHELSQAGHETSVHSSQGPSQAQKYRAQSAEQRVSTPTQPSTDPRTITTWPPALRHVTKVSAIDSEFLPRIRALIANQQDNERQWWSGREALVRQQSTRAGSKRELDDVLKSVGVQSSNDTGPEDHEAELKRYDVKVHRAQGKMVQAMSEELKDLGVPFFGLRQALVREDHEKPTGDKASDGRLVKKQVLELQRKMLNFLEELCKE